MCRVWLCLCLVACNQAFDLRSAEVIDAAQTAPPDFDHDGVEDSVDNCLFAANGDQRDSDGDGFGDACDTCPTLPTVVNHDEDGDSHGDDCDVCPAIADFQDDFDSNGIGDACTGGTLQAGSRRLFDPFLTLDPTRWVAGATPWASHNDAAGPTQPLQPDDPGLALLMPEVSGTTWQVSVGFVSARHWANGDRFGITITDASDALFVACTVSCTGTFCSEVMTRPSLEKATVIAPSPTTSINVSTYHNTSDGIDYVLCSLNGQIYLADVAALVGSAKVHIVAMPDLPASYAEVLQ